MYTAHLFFNGPKTRWTGKLAEAETLASFDAPWLWLARWTVRGLWARLDREKCGYIILHDGVEILKVDPQIESEGEEVSIEACEPPPRAR